MLYMGNEMDIVDIIKQNKRFGVVEGKEAVYEKIDELSKKDNENRKCKKKLSTTTL